MQAYKSFLKSVWSVSVRRISIIVPIMAWLVLGIGHYLNINHIAAYTVLSTGFLIAAVLVAVHHSEIIAHKVGEPFGTILLAISITVIEVGLIISLMLAGGEETAALARDTVFAAVMIITSGIVGLCLLIGGMLYKEQVFRLHGANAALTTLAAIVVLTLILPNYTTSNSGPTYNPSQLGFIALVSLVLYFTFIFVQIKRHKNYFLDSENSKASENIKPGEKTKAGGNTKTGKNTQASSARSRALVKKSSLSTSVAKKTVSNKTASLSFVWLLSCLAAVVLLAKSLAPSIEATIMRVGAPHQLLGVIIAAIVLLPEGLAAVRAARNNQFQTSLNLAIGSALASIGLTIPAVAVLSLITGWTLILGIDTKSTVLLLLTLFVSALSLSTGRTNVLQGVILLVIFAVYLFTTIVP